MSYDNKPSNLIHGAPLEIEDLDMSGMGLYLEEQCDINDPDVFDSGCLSLGRTLYKKKSDEGKKWHVFSDTDLKLHKDLKKNE
jgi:hypothetical protein